MMNVRLPFAVHSHGSWLAGTGTRLIARSRMTFKQSGAVMRGFQGPMEPSLLLRGGLEPSGIGTIWNPLGPGRKKGKCLIFINDPLDPSSEGSKNSQRVPKFSKPANGIWNPLLHSSISAPANKNKDQKRGSAPFWTSTVDISTEPTGRMESADFFIKNRPLPHSGPVLAPPPQMSFEATFACLLFMTSFLMYKSHSL